MKRIIASAGVVALGAAGVQAAAQVPGFLSVDGSKPWSVSATLRGFYDDNVNTVPDSNPAKENTYGFQISPSVSLRLPVGQTALGLSYTYSLKYFDKRPMGNVDNYDQTHVFNAGLDHAFSERFQLSVTDSFVIGQEPDSLRAGNAFTTFQRVPGDNIRNYGTIKLSSQVTRLFGVELGYANSMHDYDASGPGSLSASLDRIEHLAHFDGRWQVFRETVGIIGYQYGQTDYTGDESIGGGFMSDDRNNRSHYGYVGVEHNFRADLSGSLRGGVRYTDFYSDAVDEREISPYAQASLRYVYTAESYVTLGAGYDRNSTYQLSTLDADSIVVFASLRQRILPNLYGSVTGQFQNSTFNGGIIDNETERYYLVDLNLEYRFSPYLSAEVGYNYDQADADFGGNNFDFTRNRVYLGVTARY